MTIRFLTLALVLATSACATPDWDQFAPERISELRAAEDRGASQIHWEIVNRFRLLKGEDEEDRFYRNFVGYAEARQDWFEREQHRVLVPNLLHAELIPTRRFFDGSPQLFNIHYSGRGYPEIESDEVHEGLYSGYDPRILAATHRMIRLTFPAPDGAQCEWRREGRDPRLGPCRGKTMPSIILNEETQIAARLAGSGDDWTYVSVLPRDAVIVALGDSYSAGEGNPHTQWRFFSQHRRPASWLDARCHRSLISGPAIAAAYIARQNPHLSVSLLHYGCSGASVADGIAAPGSMLETYHQVERRHHRNTLLFGRIPWFHDPDYIDQLDEREYRPNLIMSQIDQARYTLRNGGHRSADAIFISEGGNSVGFAGIASSFIVHWITQADLLPDEARWPHPDRPEDARRYGAVDSMRWSQIAELFPTRDADDQPLCATAGGEQDIRACLAARVAHRINHHLAGQGEHPFLPQYDFLNSRLRQGSDGVSALVTEGNEDNVIITGYPSPVWRDENDPNEPLSGNLVGCIDTAFDRRPGSLPGIIAQLPGLGLDAGDAEAIDAQIITPLNTAIEATAQRFNWTFADTHVSDIEHLGICSLIQRTSNTLADAFFLQSTPGAGREPLGQILIEPELAVELGLPAGDDAGTIIEWDFTIPHPTRQNEPERYGTYCVVEPSTGRRTDVCIPPASVSAEHAPAGTFWDDGLMLDPNRAGSRPSSAAAIPTGAIHPSMEGHCAYAAALVTAFVGTLQDDEDREAELRAALSDGFATEPLDGALLCSAEAWGPFQEEARPAAQHH